MLITNVWDCIKLGCSQVVSLSSFRNVNLIINVLFAYYMHIDVLTITTLSRVSWVEIN